MQPILKLVRQFLPAAALAVLFAGCPGVADAQAARTFRGRLSPVPLDVAMQATISGGGSVSATLSGTTLTIDGTFDGLKSPATVGRVHIGRKGVRGPAFFDLKVSNGTGGANSGTLGGVFQLTPLQIDALTKGSFYVQLHSEKAPDGNLWGWLAQADAKR